MDKKYLIRQAFFAMENAYAPYSKFRVGAAILAASGKIYTGCNVESCSFPAGICAERTALVKAVSEGEREFLALAVVSSGSAREDYTSPCGICRQMLLEFCADSMPVVMAKSEDDYIEVTLGTLIPLGFSPAKLLEERP